MNLQLTKLIGIPLFAADAQANATPPTEFRLFPKGKHTSEKGTFTFSDKSAKSVLKRAKEKGNDIPIDYEHFMLASGEDLPAGAAGGVPAAGWFNVEVREGELWATNVRWTDKARNYLTQKEYRFMSPAFRHTEEGEITEIVNCALVNLPAQHHQTPLVAAKDDDEETITPKEPPAMDHLFSLLKLSKSAPESEAVAVVTTLQAERKQLLEATGKATLEEALGAISALKTAKLELEKANQKLLEMQAKEHARKVERLVSQGIKEKKIAPAMKEQFIEQGMNKNGIKFLKSYLETAAPLVSTKQVKHKTDDDRGIQLEKTDAELSVIAQKVGVKLEDLKKQLGAA